jgi:hypothetical protein
MRVTMRLPRFLTSALLLFVACTFHEPLQPNLGDGGASDAAADGVPGNRGGAGGHTGAGGATGAGGRVGTGGAVATGGHRGAGGVTGAGGTVDAGPDLPPDSLTCGPVCAIFCPNGNVLDDRGCPTCACKPTTCPPVRCEEKCKFGFKNDANGCQTCICNPKPACTPVTCKIACPNGFETDDEGCEICKCKQPAACEKQDCGPAPGAPNIMCSDGSLGGPVCERLAEGRCAWIFRQCPDPTPSSDCKKAITAITCALDQRCRWLEPGCTEPKLPAAGCFDRDEVGCRIDSSGPGNNDHTCPAGKACVTRVINPCSPPLPAPIPGICNTCGETVAVCL